MNQNTGCMYTTATNVGEPSEVKCLYSCGNLDCNVRIGFYLRLYILHHVNADTLSANFFLCNNVESDLLCHKFLS